MDLTDLSKDLRKVLLDHWSKDEINERLEDPEYFFDQVVNPRLKYLRDQGNRVPTKVRFSRDPKGNPLALLIP